jgi:hypothetical protein
MALSGIQLSAGIVVGSNTSVDAKFGPYADVATAKSEIGSTLRYKGLTVGILVSGSVEEYWWESGTTDSDLVAKGGSTTWGSITGTLSSQTDLQTALDAKTNKLITTNRQTASYTLVLSDADKLVEMNVGSANNLTVPLNSSVAFSTGTQILLAQYGAGQTTIVATSGVTIRSNGAKLKLNAQYSGATLVKIAENEWYLFGDIAS